MRRASIAGAAVHVAPVMPDSFAAILQRNMSPAAWQRLHVDIRKRFATPITAHAPLQFSGTMESVYCSLLGALIARLLRPFHILPETNESGIPFSFGIEAGQQAFTKTRHYHLLGRELFTFASQFSDTPVLQEEFGGGLGMYLELAEEKGTLIFRDRGYFLRLGRWRLPLPRLLTIGTFELLHSNIDSHRFRVSIRISHPLLGTLFYQHGEFHGA